MVPVGLPVKQRSQFGQGITTLPVLLKLVWLSETFCIAQPALEHFRLLLSFGVPSCKNSKFLKVFA